MLHVHLSIHFSNNNLMIKHKGKIISLDPTRHYSSSSSNSIAFLSHAHTDHIFYPSSYTGKVLASEETVRIAYARGYRYSNVMSTSEASSEGLEMIDSGHVLGSKALLIDGKILYTGDVCTRDRAFLKGARLPRCDIMIVESTYGMKGFRFPSIDDVVHKANMLISDLYAKGLPVILMGYPFGKAQIVTNLFKHWAPIYIHEQVLKINSIYEELGVDLGVHDAIAYTHAKENGMLDKKPWVMIAPKQSNDTIFIRYMKKHYNAVTVAFTGWAVAKMHMHMYMKHDYTLPLSDHCDFIDLVNLVRSCNPSKVYTFHGFADEFASYLKSIGYDAEPIHVLSDDVNKNEKLLYYI
jgi:putative mRNA 3-end processing factor